MADLEKITKKRLGEILLAEGVINQDQLQKTLKTQEQTGELLGELLVKAGFTTETEIAKTLCAQFAKPFLRPTKYDIPKEVVALLPPKMMAEHQFIPIDRFGNLLVIAIAGLLDAATVAQVQKLTNCEIEVYIATGSDVKTALRTAFPDLYDPSTLAPRLDLTGEMTMAHRPDSTQSLRAGPRKAESANESTMSMAAVGAGGPARGNGGAAEVKGEKTEKKATEKPGEKTEKKAKQPSFEVVPETRKTSSLDSGNDFEATSSQLGMTTGDFKALKAEEDSDWDALFQEAEENVMRQLEADHGPTPPSAKGKKK